MNICSCVKLTYKWDGRYSLEALIAKPNFHSRAIFGENLVAVQLSRTEVTIKKPIYIGNIIIIIIITSTILFSIFNFRYGSIGY